MRRGHMRGWIAAGTVLALACGDAPGADESALEPGPEQPSVETLADGLPGRDSAGVRIVEWEAEPEATATLSVEQLYVHGPATGGYTFGQFGPSALLADGRAVVTDLLNRELLVVSADGSESTIIARGGEGADSLGAVRGLHAAGGDTIWLQDGTRERFARFVSNTLDEVWSTADRPSLSRGLRMVGADSSGDFMMTTSAFSPRFETEWLTGHMARYSPTTGALDTVATYDLAPRMTQGQIDPFSPFGEVTVAGGRWVQTRSDRAQLTWRESDGTLVGILRWNPEPTMPIEQNWLDFLAGIEENIRRNNPDLTEPVIQQLLQQQTGGFVPRPRQPLPHFFSPVGDREGRVWLPEYMPDRRHPRLYRLVDSDGSWLGEVEFPTGTIVLDARGDRVLGRIADETGVQSLVVYRLDIGPA